VPAAILPALAAVPLAESVAWLSTACGAVVDCVVPAAWAVAPACTPPVLVAPVAVLRSGWVTVERTSTTAPGRWVLVASAAPVAPEDAPPVLRLPTWVPLPV
jgi:hypothetical protein